MDGDTEAQRGTEMRLWVHPAGLMGLPPTSLGQAGGPLAPQPRQLGSGAVSCEGMASGVAVGAGACFPTCPRGGPC